MESPSPFHEALSKDLDSLPKQFVDQFLLDATRGEAVVVEGTMSRV